MFVGAIGPFDGAVYGVALRPVGLVRPVRGEVPEVPPVERVEGGDSGSAAEVGWLEAMAAMVRGGGPVILDREAGSWQVFMEDDSPGLRRRLDRIYRGDAVDAMRRRRHGQEAWSRSTRWAPSRFSGSSAAGDTGHSAEPTGRPRGSRGLDFERIVRVLEGVLDRHVRAADGRIGPKAMGRLRQTVERLQRSLRGGGEATWDGGDGGDGERPGDDAVGAVLGGDGRDESADPVAVVERIGRAFEAELDRIAAEGRPGGDAGDADGGVDAVGGMSAESVGGSLSETGVLETLRQAFAAEVEQLRQSLERGEIRPVDGSEPVHNRSRLRAEAGGSAGSSVGVEDSSVGVGMAGLIVDAVA